MAATASIREIAAVGWSQLPFTLGGQFRLVHSVQAVRMPGQRHIFNASFLSSPQQYLFTDSVH